MDHATEFTILDLAYELLNIYGPLTVEEMSSLAEDLGYQVSGWEFEAEIKRSVLASQGTSPFLKSGHERYELLEAQEEMHPPAIHLQHYLPAGVTMALVAILALSILLGGLGRRGKTNLIFLPTTLIDSLSQPNMALAAEPAKPPPPSMDWWFDHPINQMNLETQAVARQLLSNPYNTCGPAVVALLASYYRSSNPDGPVQTADVLQTAHNQLGYYTPPYNSGLLTFKHLREMLKVYGLMQTYPSENRSLVTLEDLLQRVRQGHPAIAGMRYRYPDDLHYRPGGGKGLYNHFVIVFGLEQEDGEEYLWVSNPHPGKYIYEDNEATPVRMLLTEFWRSWALLDGTENANMGHAIFFEG
jgi:hypothetical protein